MILSLKNYPPHRDTVLRLPDAGLVVVQGENGSGKSTLAEAYAAALWGKCLRGASPWRSEGCALSVTLPGLHVERTPTSLLLSGHGALKPSKKQPEVTALVGEFTTWQRTRVFDADLTARFGAESDSERKRLLEKLLGLERFDEALKRVRAKFVKAALPARVSVEDDMWSQRHVIVEELFGGCPPCQPRTKCLPSRR